MSRKWYEGGNCAAPNARGHRSLCHATGGVWGRRARPPAGAYLDWLAVRGLHEVQRVVLRPSLGEPRQEAVHGARGSAVACGLVQQLERVAHEGGAVAAGAEPRIDELDGPLRLVVLPPGLVVALRRARGGGGTLTVSLPVLAPVRRVIVLCAMREFGAQGRGCNAQLMTT